MMIYRIIQTKSLPQILPIATVKDPRLKYQGLMGKIYCKSQWFKYLPESLSL